MTTLTITLRDLEPDRLRAFVTQLLSDTDICRCDECQAWVEDGAPLHVPCEHDEDWPMNSDEIRADHRDALYALYTALATAITTRDTKGLTS